MPRTVLHIGAHKTATTYIQRKLANNAELLAGMGIRTDPPNIVRKRFTAQLHDIASGPNDYMRELAAAARTGDLIVSDENILGAPGNLVGAGTFYNKAKDRLRAAATALDVDRPEIFLALREYSSFTVSMYSEFVRHRDFLPFADYFARFEQSGFSWATVVADVLAAVPGARLTVWDFTVFRSIEKQVFDALVGRDSANLAEPEGPVRESFSEPAMRALHALHGTMSSAEIATLLVPIARSFPKNDTNPGYAPVPAQTRDHWRKRYEADLEEIRSRYPAVTFIG